MSLNWYVLRVKPNKERTVFHLLQSRGIGVYYPYHKVEPKNPRAARERPYFPGYLFVQADLVEMGANGLNWIPGAHGLVTFGDWPAIVPPNLIAEIKQRLTAFEGNGGFVLKFKKGDRVRIVDGLFEGYEAIFDSRLPGDRRVQVLLSFLSASPQTVKLDLVDIAALRQ